MLFNLLSDTLDQKTATVFWISIIAIALILLVGIIMCFTAKRLKPRALVYAGVTIALSFCLSFIKFTPVTYGGSITLASMLPVMIFAYFYGFAPGLLCGVCHGLLQFISSPYLLTPVTFILDYILAFAVVCLVPVFKKVKNKTLSLSFGISAAYAARFFFHLISGIIYFQLGSIWTDLPQSSALIYSFLYQTVYLVPDYFITLVAAIILFETGTLKFIKPKSADKE